ncbi:hypothetical protein E2C01_065466 [Portunus trituberculatus]|uniref:Uncharacterized protein n=1 Tax=Portunus trituberculatus TaxID=210409 RepID=A0A5B7HRT8_PORTR|nr:hypothetical protein [Portunus trituberculatus]
MIETKASVARLRDALLVVSASRGRHKGVFRAASRKLAPLPLTCGGTVNIKRREAKPPRHVVTTQSETSPHDLRPRRDKPGGDVRAGRHNTGATLRTGTLTRCPHRILTQISFDY